VLEVQFEGQGLVGVLLRQKKGLFTTPVCQTVSVVRGGPWLEAHIKG